MDDLDIGFTDYCIVCDRAIAPVKEREQEKEVKTAKKKAAGGTIRVKNADGTVMIRNANGTKTTRPPLRRGPNSATRLAMAAVNNTAKLHPLTRSKTTGTDTDDKVTSNTDSGSNTTDSPESIALKTPKTPLQPFHSAIYCSRTCAQSDSDRSNDLARRMSYDTGLHLVTSDLPLSGSSKSPYGPPSPMCMSGSDTSSNNDPASAGIGPASVPKGFFNFGKEGPDDAWNAVNRQRRSSMHPTTNFRPTSMSRQPSQASHVSVAPSSDSLNSMWSEHEPIARSVSGSGQIRLTPMPSTIPTRPVPRATFSNTSLGASPRPSAIPAEFGSAPEHTYDLWNSFNNCFVKRDATGTSVSRGFVEIGSTPTASPPLASSRRPSYSINRVGGTIRANKSSVSINPTWDSFGQEELRAKERRSSMRAPMSFGEVDQHGSTPKQSIEVGKNGCQIKYYQPGTSYTGTSLHSRPVNPRRTSARSIQSFQSDSSSDLENSHYASTSTTSGALQIPRSQLATSSSSSGRTPTTRLLPISAVPTRPDHMPDLAALRVGSGGCVGQAGSATGQGTGAGAGSSAPRSTWNWAEFEKKGGKTYEVPPGLKAHAGKSGLFYFQ